MTTAATSLPSTLAAPSRAWLPVLAGCAIYAVLLNAGDQLLRDPDTYWQVTLGNWIIDHRAVPHTDIYSWTMNGAPWISTQWLSQVLFAASYRAIGWGGPVLLAALAVGAAFGLLTHFVGRRLAPIPTLALVSAAFALSVAHLVARPHVLAMPVMVLWAGGLVAALDRRASPSFWLLPLMTLWANLHGGFVFGVALIGPIAIGTVFGASKEQQGGLLVRWIAFGLLAIAAACITPYGADSILASQRILSLGKALALIGEWRPADFGHVGPLEAAVLGGFGLALWRGFRLSPIRMLLVIGLVFMALSHIRNAEVLALIAPMILARPLQEQAGGDLIAPPGLPRASVIGLSLLLIAGTLALLSMRHFSPDTNTSPVAAVRVIKDRGLTHVLNDYDFGGYMISAGLPTYIDGRTELYGDLMVTHDNFTGLHEPADFFALIDDPRVEATLLRKQSAASKMLDHLDGWTRIYGDDLAVVHLRDANAKAAAKPVLRHGID